MGRGWILLLKNDEEGVDSLNLAPTYVRTIVNSLLKKDIQILDFQGSFSLQFFTKNSKLTPIKILSHTET